MLSIIIVKYRAEEEYQACLKSLASVKTLHEIITIDNNIINRGYAKGNNLGVSFAEGEYILILNPDTLVSSGAIDQMIKWLNTHHDYSMISPLLLDSDLKSYQFQGTEILTPKHGIWGLSFINKFIPDLEYWKPSEVKILPGTAIMMRKKDFMGFDENFFLYFEEADLCMRTPGKKKILESAKVIHHWARSTPKGVKPIFEQSRFYFFKKHYGIFWAIIVDMVCKISKKNLLIFLIFLLGVYLRSQLPFTFFGDAAWFYNSARDALILGKFPWLGITSSIIWLHQGPLWTFLYVPALLFSNFNPVSGSVLISILNFLLLAPSYYLLATLFSKRIALINILVVWLLPWWVYNSGLTYHTSPIPLFEVIFLLLLLKRRDFLTGLFLGLLYQLHLLTFIFWPLMLHNSKFINRKSIFGFLLGILPFLVVGPTQTFGIFVWLVKNTLTGFGGTGLASEAYRVVLFVPALILLNYLWSKIVLCLQLPFWQRMKRAIFRGV